METSLHRSLKHLYAIGRPQGESIVADLGIAGSQVEVRLDGFRIDAVLDGVLIEIQHGTLSAIRKKVARLLERHEVLVVKPIIAHKTLVKQDKRGGAIVERRLSPKRGQLLDLFDELVYFTQVFPHPRLTIEFLLVDVEEWRFPGHGRRRRWRKSDHAVEDQHLVSVREAHSFRAAEDLLRFLPINLPRHFHTGHIAAGLNISRTTAQRMAFVLRRTGAILEAGKQGNARLYALPAKRRKRKAG